MGLRKTKNSRRRGPRESAKEPMTRVLGAAALACSKANQSMRAITSAVALGLAMGLVASGAKAEFSKEQYELQERCGKAAAARFNEDFPDGQVSKSADGLLTIAGYEAFYNPRFNKCFVLYTMQSSNNGYSSTYKALFDPNSNHEYATFSMQSHNSVPLVFCKVRDEFCNSEKEWDNLVKAYTGD